ncbi:MAG: hypothetical protein KDI44_04765 [Thiothrix sp.]|nr:hypothetical protein [Thiothrix sp.]HPQ94223.1 hypothetical protein [Thiolinea sp.]
MPDVRYDLVVLQHHSEKKVEQLVNDLLHLLQRKDDPYLEYKLSEALLFGANSANKTAVLEDLTQADGEKIRQLFLEQQVTTELRPALGLVAKDTSKDEETYTCPACKHEQPLNPEQKCEKCGVFGEKYRREQQRQAIYEKEKKKLELTREQQLKETRERAEAEDQQHLREEARQRLGFKRQTRTLDYAVSAVVVMAMSVGGYYAANTLLLDDTEVPSPTQAAEPGARGAKSGLSGAAPQPGGLEFSTVTQAARQANGTRSGLDPETGLPMVQGQVGGNILAMARQLAPELSADSELAQGVDAGAPAKGTAIPAKEREHLINALHPPAMSTHMGETDTDQLAQHRASIKRLIELGRPRLALVYADEQKNPNLRSWLLTQLLALENPAQRREFSNEIVTGIRNLAARTTESPDEALVLSNLAGSYTLLGQQENARMALGKSIDALEREKLPVIDRLEKLRYMLQGQLRTGNQAGISQLTAQADELVKSQQPDTPLEHYRLVVRMAGMAMDTGQMEAANTWLKAVQDQDTRLALSHELLNIKQAVISSDD